MTGTAVHAPTPPRSAPVASGRVRQGVARTRRRLPRSFEVVLLPWALARVLVGVAYAIGVVAADELTPGDRPYHLAQGLFAWDGTFYRDLAEVGYGGVDEEALRFFPLVPLLARVVALPLFGDRPLGLLVVSNVGALAAGVLLYRLARRETGDEGLAARAAWLLALLPPAMVLVLGYAESMLLVLTIGAFLCLRSGRWWGAAGLGLAAGLCRPVGVALVLPAAIEAARGLRGTGVTEKLGRVAAVVAPIAGLAAFLAWVGAEFGDWTLPVSIQGNDELREGFANPVVRAWESFTGLGGEERLGDGLHAPWIVLFAALVVVLFRRWPAAYGAYAAGLLVVALSAEDIGSFERYGLSAFPLLLALATVLRPGRLETAGLVLCAGGLVGFSTLAFLGTFVP